MGPDEKRKPRSVKMSDAEWEEIQKRAAKLGITASEYIRNVALEKEEVQMWASALAPMMRPCSSRTASSVMNTS